VSAKETPEARQERILAELRAATAEAAGVLKDLQRTIESARERVDEYAVPQIDALAHQTANEMTADIRQLGERLTAKMQAAVNAHEAKIAEYLEREPLITAAANKVYLEVAELMKARVLAEAPDDTKYQIVIGPKPTR
jgi:hypothetical protein